MFQLLWDLSGRGISSVVVSSELEELMDICHRILVMRKGAIVGEVLPQSATLEQLFALCLVITSYSIHYTKLYDHHSRRNQ